MGLARKGGALYGNTLNSRENAQPRCIISINRELILTSRPPRHPQRVKTPLNVPSKPLQGRPDDDTIFQATDRTENDLFKCFNYTPPPISARIFNESGALICKAPELQMRAPAQTEEK